MKTCCFALVLEPACLIRYPNGTVQPSLDKNQQTLLVFLLDYWDKQQGIRNNVPFAPKFAKCRKRTGHKTVTDGTKKVTDRTP